MTIQINDGPSLSDPLGIAPIGVLGVPGCDHVVRLTVQTWRARLGIWLLRQYVNRCVSST